MARNRPPLSQAPEILPARIQVGPFTVLLVLALGFFMILLDTTIVNVAIPSIIDGLHASLDQILWILNAYVLVYAVLLITAGRLGDMIGPKKPFIGGLVLFVLSSAACGFAQSPEQLIVFRILQAVGGALLTPQSLSIIASIFPPEKRGAAFGIWASVAGAAAVAGPLLGGTLTTNFTWRAIFYVNVPLGIIAVILAVLLMPDLKQHRRHSLDLGGVLLSACGLFLGIFALIEGQRYQWGRLVDLANFSIGGVQLGLLSIWTILLYGIILLVAFVFWESRQPEPVMPLSLFRDRNFSLANMVSAMVAFAMFGLFLPFAIFLQSVLGLTAQEAGVATAPMALTSMFLAPIAGRLSERVGGKYLLGLGLLIFGAGMGLVIWVSSLSATGTTFTLPLIVAGIGMGFTFAPMVTVAMRNVAPQQAGAASGFINTVRQVGGTIGSATVGAILQNRLAYELHSQAVSYSAQLPPSVRGKFVSGFSHAASKGLEVGRGQTGGGNIPQNLPASLAHQLQSLGLQVFHHAYLNAMKPSLAVPIAVLTIGAFFTIFMDGKPKQTAGAEVPRDERSTGVAVAGE